tara:strand:+ start:6039 stop:7868 length:1830 start_codon:yes stop_codon:yes gene_type:complete
MIKDLGPEIRGSRRKRNREEPLWFLVEQGKELERMLENSSEQSDVNSQSRKLQKINQQLEEDNSANLHLRLNGIKAFPQGSAIDIKTTIDGINSKIDAKVLPISQEKQSSSIVADIIGVNDRDEIEVQRPQKQAKNIHDALHPSGAAAAPALSNPPRPYELSLAAGYSPSGSREKCYGTHQEVHFKQLSPPAPPEHSNEWEHVVPCLYQSIINGLAINLPPVRGPVIKMSTLINEVIGGLTTDQQELIDNLCLQAQNRCLLLSTNIFNQAKCSYMLYDVDYKEHEGSGNHIIKLSVNPQNANKVWNRMTTDNFGPCTFSGSGRHISTTPLLPTHPQAQAQGSELRIDANDGNSYTRDEFVRHYGGTAEWDAAPPAKFIENLKGAAKDYNDLMEGNDGLNGVIIFACGCISSAMLAYNSQSGRKTYEAASPSGAAAAAAPMPLIYTMARAQIPLLKDALARQLGGGVSSAPVSTVSDPSTEILKTDRAYLSGDVQEHTDDVGGHKHHVVERVLPVDVKHTLSESINFLNTIFNYEEIEWSDDCFYYRFKNKKPGLLWTNLAEMMGGGSKVGRKRTKKKRNKSRKLRRKNKSRKLRRKNKSQKSRRKKISN